MKAAVVRSFDRPLEIEDAPDPRARPRAGARPHRDLRPLPHRHPRRARRVAGQAVAAVHPRPRGRRHRSSASARATIHGLEPGMRVALPWLGYACGDCRYCNSGRETLCPHQLNMGYAIDGGFAEYARRLRAPRRPRARRRRPRRRRAADLRRRHHLQGGQGLRRALVGPRRRVRRRRPRPPRRSSTRASPARRWSPSTSTRSGSRAARAARRRARRQRRARRTRSPRSSGSAAPTPRSRPPSRPTAFEQAFALARPRRHARLRRPAGRQRDASCRSSRPCSAASTCAARSSAPATTSRRSSSCTAAA